MDWPIERNPSHRILRQFAGAWLVVGGLIAWRFGFPMQPGVGNAVLAALAVGVGGLGLVVPRVVRWPFVLLSLVTWPIGWVVARVLLAVVYYGLFTPLALAFRLAGRDALRLRVQRGAATYWVARPATVEMQRYFRQF